MIQETWIIVRSFGYVYSFLDMSTKEVVAIKCIKQTKKEFTVLNEVKNAQKCVSPFTVLIKDAFQYDMQDWVSAMECNDDSR